MIRTKALLIGYFSLSESLVKLGLSALLSIVVPGGPAKEKILVLASAIVGGLGIVTAIRLIRAVKAGSASLLVRWMLWQLASIAVLVCSLFAIDEIVQGHRSLQRYEIAVYTFAVAYASLQVYFLLSIVLLYLTLKEGESSTVESPLLGKQLIKENV